MDAVSCFVFCHLAFEKDRKMRKMLSFDLHQIFLKKKILFEMADEFFSKQKNKLSSSFNNAIFGKWGKNVDNLLYTVEDFFSSNLFTAKI